MNTYRICDYDKREEGWLDIQAETWLDAVAMCLEIPRKRISFMQPVALPPGMTFAVYGRSPTGGHTKVGAVQCWGKS